MPPTCRKVEVRAKPTLPPQRSIAIDNARAYERIRELSLRDEHTGLYNSRHLWRQLDLEAERTRRTGRPFSLLFIDLDHFKQVNDRHGHAAGDEALRQLAALMTARSRTEDVPCRFGGEEFLLLMPGSSLDIAMERAELLRVAFEAIEVPSEHGLLRCTVSIGVASFPQHGDSQDALVRCADLALYAAKRGGRNGVLAYQDGLAR